MPKRQFLFRFLSLFLALSLAPPGSAQALRQTRAEESEPTKQRLISALTQPQAGLEEPPWPMGTGRSRGIEEFPEPVRLQLAGAASFGQRVIILSDFLGWSGRQLSQRAGLSPAVVNDWRRQERNVYQSSVANVSAVLHADPIFLLTGQPEEAALRPGPLVVRAKLLSTAAGLSDKALASMVGSSRKALDTQNESMRRSTLFMLSGTLNRPPVLIETGFPLPLGKSLEDVSGRKGFNRGLLGGKRNQRWMEQVGNLQEGLVRAWRGANEQGRHFSVEEWEQQISPDLEHGYAGLAARLLAAYPGTLDLGVRDGLLTREIADKLRAQRALDETEISDLAYRLADAHEQLQELFEAMPILRPPRGYGNSEARRRIANTWDLIARFMTRDRLLLLLNSSPLAYKSFKPRVVVSMDPEVRVLRNEHRTEQLLVQFSDLSGLLVRTYVWTYSNPVEMLQEARRLRDRLEELGQWGQLRSLRYDDASLESPRAFASRMINGGVSHAQTILEQVTRRDAALRVAAASPAAATLSDLSSDIPGLNPAMGQARDLLNRVVAWRQLQDPAFFQYAPDPADSEESGRFQAEIVRPFVDLISKVLQTEKENGRLPQNEQELPSFTKRLAESLTDLSAAGLEENSLQSRMPEWLRRVTTPEEFLESVYRANDPAVMTERVAVLVQPELLAGAGEDLSDAAVRLMSLEENLRSVFGWPDRVKLRLDPWSEGAEQEYLRQGYRVVQMVRDERDKMRDPLPQELLLLALSQAVASGQDLFAINVTHYLALRGLTFEEVRAQLTDLYA